MKKQFIIVASLCVLAGCASLSDVPKKVAGVSTRVLEDTRAHSIYQSYDCDTTACFDSVLDVARKNKYVVFMKDDIRGFIVLMGIPGCVDTTEVGVFLTPQADGKGVKVEISSRSSPAKRTVALVLFEQLAQKYKKI
ncbi:MAG: hypothetical protein HQL16_06375 [Candidatus Omnitrophica bacterium]|nr:hypothetical protein [Candidatus Omnitrophota bacterium]